MTQFDQVSVVKKSNVFHDGRCISHTVIFPDGSRKTVGVLLPSTLTFNTNSAETMDILSGSCRVRLPGKTGWEHFGAGESFFVPANSSFDIEVSEATDYVCSFE